MVGCGLAGDQPLAAGCLGHALAGVGGVGVLVRVSPIDPTGGRMSLVSHRGYIVRLSCSVS